MENVIVGFFGVGILLILFFGLRWLFNWLGDGDWKTGFLYIVLTLLILIAIFGVFYYTGKVICLISPNICMSVGG